VEELLIENKLDSQSIAEEIIERWRKQWCP
jgi:hypothetical protein